jgi:hypothetical protein
MDYELLGSLERDADNAVIPKVSLRTALTDPNLLAGEMGRCRPDGSSTMERALRGRFPKPSRRWRKISGKSSGEFTRFSKSFADRLSPANS